MAAKRDSLTGVDTAWWRMEHPTNLMMITGVLIFDEPVDFDRLRHTVEKRLLRFDRFRQRVVQPRNPLATPYWEPEPNFDLRAHLHRIALRPPGDQQALEELVSYLMSTPLDFSKSPWEYHLIENYQGGAVLMGRLHHVMGDGIALMRVLLSMTDDSRHPLDDEEDQHAHHEHGALSALVGTARSAMRGTQTLLHEGMETLVNPGRVLDSARDVTKMGASGATALARLALRLPDPPTIFKGPLGTIKKAAWSQPISLEDVKAVGGVTGGTVNDVLLTAMTGALRRYMQSRRERVDGLNFRAIVPVNLRPPDAPLELGNKFGLVFLSLPIGIADPVERLAELKRRMDDLKHTPEAVVAFGLLNVFGVAPTEVESVAVEIFGAKATAVMTNVPGPRQTIYLAGSRMSGIMFWVPQSARLGLGVSIISYAGRVWLGVAVDAGLVPDPERIIAAFHEEFGELMQLVYAVQPDYGAAQPATADRAAQPAVQRCQATTKSGSQCRNRALPGADFCRIHQ